MTELIRCCAMTTCPEQCKSLIISSTNRQKGFADMSCVKPVDKRCRLVVFATSDSSRVASCKAIIKHFVPLHGSERRQLLTRPGVMIADLLGMDTNVSMNQNDISVSNRLLDAARYNGLIPCLAPQSHLELEDTTVRARAREQVSERDGICHGIDCISRRSFTTVPIGSTRSTRICNAKDAILRAQPVEMAALVPGRDLVCAARDRIMAIWLNIFRWETQGTLSTRPGPLRTYIKSLGGSTVWVRPALSTRFAYT